MYNIFILMLILFLYFSRAVFLNTGYLRDNVRGKYYAEN